MIFETHAHFDDSRFDADRDEILGNLESYGIEHVINIGADMKGSRASVEFAEKYDRVYASVGVHPDEIEKLTDADYDWMCEMAKHPKVIAIGECGLDYNTSHQSRSDKEKQLQAEHFRRHINVALKAKLPLIVHSRDAAEDTFNILKDYVNQLASKESDGNITSPGVVHCYSYSPEIAREYVKDGWYIGVGGVVTFKNAKNLVKTVEETDISRILLETDCPYLAPEPHRGERNDSRYLTFVAEKIAAIKGISYDEVIEATAANAHELFKI